jgi:NAD+ synthase
MTDKTFDPETTKNEIVDWIREFFKNTGGKIAVVGISGGKDSSIVAALCKEALGAENVLGCLLPKAVREESRSYNQRNELCNAVEAAFSGNSKRKIDFDKLNNYTESIMSFLTGVKLCRHLSIPYICKEIEPVINSCYGCLPTEKGRPIFTKQAVTNLPARIRMTLLYAIAQTVDGGRVANTSNFSEDWVGYATRWGDSVGDFAPLARFTVSEVKQIGYALKLPEEFIERIPSDGLCGKSDEENLGFSYAVLDKYIRTGEIDDPEVKAKIDALHKKNLFKFKPIPAFSPNISFKGMYTGCLEAKLAVFDLNP